MTRNIGRYRSLVGRSLQNVSLVDREGYGNIYNFNMDLGHMAVNMKGGWNWISFGSDGRFWY
jgi:hypothetical protein